MHVVGPGSFRVACRHIELRSRRTYDRKLESVGTMSGITDFKVRAHTQRGDSADRHLPIARVDLTLY